MNALGDEVVAEGVHLEQRCHPDGVPEVIAVDALGEAGTAAGSTQRMTGSIFPASFAGRKGQTGELDPPPVQPTSRSGSHPSRRVGRVPPPR